jgi:hypothetical protein
MRARGTLAAVIMVVMAVGVLVGCSKKLAPIQNLPPDTYVSIQGGVDLVNHRVHLYWYGTDPDGSITGYKFRWVYPLPASQDPAWVTILAESGRLRTDSMFTMFTGDSAQVTPRFEIYAIDNEGLADPTPAKQRFLLGNVAPIVRFTNPLGLADTTYASATVSWETIDPDGGGPGLRYRVWMAGNEANYDSTTAQTFTIPSSRFLRNGVYASRRCSLYVQPVDDGGRQGEPVMMNWYTRAPAQNLEDNQGRLLVIDDLPTGGNDEIYDAFYRSVYSLLPAGTFDVLRIQFNPNIFRCGLDVTQTFRQFKAVLWYRGDAVGTDGRVSPLLTAYQDDIGAWLDGGGKLYLDGLYLIQGLNTPGSFREDFVRGHLGSTGLYNCFADIGNGAKDSTAGWSSRGGSNGTIFRSSRYGETFRAVVGPKPVAGVTGGERGFVVADTSTVALWATDGSLSPANTGFEVPVGVTVPQGSGGRLVLLTMPVRFAAPAVATRLLQRMLYEFGIGMPLP